MGRAKTSGLFADAEVGHRVEKQDYEAQVEKLRVELLNLQYDLRQADFPVLLVVVGDDRPGCVDLVHTLHEWMDARYIGTHVLLRDELDPEERERPPFWRYWRRLPPKGRIGLFLGAWPAEVVDAALREEWSELEYDGVLDHVERFERELAEDGALVLKFWLHLPKKVLAKRLAKARKKRGAHWQLEERDWRILDVYDEGLRRVERLLRRTDSSLSPWSVVESTDHRFRNLSVGTALAAALGSRLVAGPPAAAPSVAAETPPVDGRRVLDRVDLSATLDEESYERELDALQSRLNELTREARARGVTCLIAFEGWDAAGKGGCIRRLTRAMPVGNYQLVPIAAPTEEERAHHWLWRFWRHLPRAGRTLIYDRSWYGRVLVERVEGFAREDQWRRAYAEINDFEAQVQEHGIPVLKFWLEIDAEEQLRRFEARAKTPYKKYKLTDEDLRNREKRPLYEAAVHDMVVETSTSYAPWTLVAANDKRHARIEVLRNVCERLAERLAEDGSGEGRKRGRKRGKKKRRS
jgi:polyphosphate:AMP phosphotransferase